MAYTGCITQSNTKALAEMPGETISVQADSIFTISLSSANRGMGYKWEIKNTGNDCIKLFDKYIDSLDARGLDGAKGRQDFYLRAKHAGKCAIIFMDIGPERKSKTNDTIYKFFTVIIK